MRIVKNIVIFTVVFAASMAAADLYLQTAEIYTPMKSEIDPEIGPTFDKGARVARFNEGFYLGRINDQGYSGPSVPKERRPDERRILLMGDSFVLGMQVFQRDHFGTLLQNDLDAHTPGDVRILNFGQGDFNLSNMYQYYLDFASTWDHDLALFFVSNGDLLLMRPVNVGMYPECYVEGDSIRIDYSFRDTERFKTYKRLEPIAQRSALARMSLNTQRMVRRGELKTQFLGKFAGLLPSRDMAQARKNERRPDLEESADITRGILAALSANPKAVVVLKTALGDDARGLLQEYDLPVWDLHPLLTELEQEGHDPYYWEVSGKRGHWNHRAHRRIADYLAHRILQSNVWRTLDSEPVAAAGKSPDGTAATP